MKPETKESLIWIFCIVIVLLLTAKIIVESKDYSCDKCEVTLYNEIDDRPAWKFGTFKISELYYEHKNGHCMVTWDATQGFVNG